MESFWSPGMEMTWGPLVPGRGLGSPALSDRLDRWEQALRQRDASAWSHLVWTRERLARLEQLAETVVREDPEVASEWVGWFTRALVNRVTGLGPLDRLLLDDSVEDILVNGVDNVYCVRLGAMEPVDLDLGDSEDLLVLAQRLASRAGTVINTEHPMADAELADGSRIHCAIPPVVEEPCITIRRRRQRKWSVEEALEAGSLDAEGWQCLVELIRAQRNILVTGGAGVGKTTLLSMLVEAVPEEERLVVIEDVREVVVQRRNLVRLMTAGRWAVHDLVVQALRMRPDRIVVGEVRGEEAFDLLEAMASGHAGSLATLHSRSGGWAPLHRLARLAQRRARGFAFEQMLEQIVETVDAVVWMQRDGVGRRWVASIEAVGPSGVKPLWRHPSPPLR
jgi:pilus assembly protein CpaF